ncbi:MAG: TPM domain-containing protein, partial [Muribaculaceae bacterium]|nr:TPM domain-containing protein [Muribaculaceae bacterium]
MLVLFMLAVFYAPARVYKPSDMPNPNVADSTAYVSDPGNMMGGDAKSRVNSRLNSLRNSTTAEVAVAIVPDMGDVDIETFDKRMFKEWKVGKKDSANGVLLVIAPEQRKVRIETGYGTEGILPDIACRRIIDRYVIPSMRDNDLDGAVVGASEAIASALSDPTVAEELRSASGNNRPGEEPPISSDDMMSFIISVIIIMAVVTAVWFVFALIKSRRNRNTYS